MKKNREILALIDDYNLFMDSEKTTASPINVIHTKANHNESLYSEQPVVCSQGVNNVDLACELRQKSTTNYSIQLLSRDLTNRLLFRMDEGNGTHRNNLPYIPLSEQSVPTPHFHRYDSNGYNIAYKSEVIKNIAEPLHINEGLALFCLESNTHADDGLDLSINIQEEGFLPMPDLYNNNDPLANIKFE